MLISASLYEWWKNAIGRRGENLKIREDLRKREKNISMWNLQNCPRFWTKLKTKDSCSNYGNLKSTMLTRSHLIALTVHAEKGNHLKSHFQPVTFPKMPQLSMFTLWVSNHEFYWIDQFYGFPLQQLELDMEQQTGSK